jgi:hypothetical protein
LRLGWSLLDVAATWSKYRWLQYTLHCICNDWCAAIAKKDSCKTECGWLQILSQCDCTLIAVWLRLQKTGKKSAIAINQFKKSSMPWHYQIATRLVFAWCGCNLVKIQVIANILDSVVANRW